MAGVDLLFGPMLIGAVLNMIMYGVVSMQMFTYYQRYTHDLMWIRYFMLYLFIVETAVVVVEVGILYEPLIMEYGTTRARVFYPKLLPGDSLLIAIVSTPIQNFTAWRIKVITGSYIIPAIISLLSIASFAGGIFVSVMIMLHSQFRDFETFTSGALVWLACSAACDVLIAIGMTYALYNRYTGFNRVTDGHINRIVRLTIETGSLTAAAALADILLFILFPLTTTNFIVDFPLSSLYTCSVLAMLNSREPKMAPDDAEHGRSASAPRTAALFSNVTHQRLRSQPSLYTITGKTARIPRDDVSELSLGLPMQSPPSSHLAMDQQVDIQAAPRFPLTPVRTHARTHRAGAATARSGVRMELDKEFKTQGRF